MSRMGEAVMSIAQDRCAAGIKNSSATAAFDNAITDFETMFAPAYDGTDKWMAEGRQGKPHDMESFQEPLNILQDVAISGGMNCRVHC